MKYVNVVNYSQCDSSTIHDYIPEFHTAVMVNIVRPKARPQRRFLYQSLRYFYIQQ